MLTMPFWNCPPDARYQGQLRWWHFEFRIVLRREWKEASAMQRSKSTTVAFFTLRVMQTTFRKSSRMGLTSYSTSPSLSSVLRCSHFGDGSEEEMCCSAALC